MKKENEILAEIIIDRNGVTETRQLVKSYILSTNGTESCVEYWYIAKVDGRPFANKSFKTLGKAKIYAKDLIGE